MKILYITPSSKRRDHYVENKEYDFPEISKQIKNGIHNYFNDAEIIFASELLNENGTISDESLQQFDLCLCDVTTANPSALFYAGKVEGIKKPIIYFASHESVVLPTVRNNRHLLYSEATIDDEFIDELNNWIKEVKANPESTKSKLEKTPKKPKAFISYSHNDSEYMKRLLVHLKPLERKGLIDIWRDTKIKTGDKWKEKITKALSESNIALLLISADFMASDFIVENELPPLLSKAEVQGTKILPVILSHCRFSREDSLNRFQAANSPDKPLSVMSECEREEIYDKIATDIEVALKMPNHH